MTKKIMFNDKYCLTQAVLDRMKTMTRRVLKEGTPLGNWEETAKCLPYKVGEVVAIAQSYKDIYNELEAQGNWEANEWWCSAWDIVGGGLDTSAGYRNKMFVRADLMPRHIQFTDVKVERFQDISDDDILREGIRKESFADGCMFCYSKAYMRNGNRLVDPIYNSTPRSAFASLMYKIIGGYMWESNPWVVAYSFELVD